MVISLKLVFIGILSVSIAGNCFFMGYYIGNENKKEETKVVDESKNLEASPVIKEIQNEYLEKVVPFQVEIKNLQKETIGLLQEDKFIPAVFRQKTNELFEKEMKTKKIQSGIIIKFASNSKLGDRINIATSLKSGLLKVKEKSVLGNFKFKQKSINKRIEIRTDFNEIKNEQKQPNFEYHEELKDN